MTSGYAEAASTSGTGAAFAVEISSGGSAIVSRGGRSSVRRAAVAPRRMIAPADAPVSSSVPASSASTPTIATPVPPRARPSAPLRVLPRYPPESPSVSMRPRARTASPVRNGRTSTRSLRRDHEPADDDEREREPVRSSPDESLEPVSDPAADVTPVPAGPEHRGEEQAEREQDEPGQLGMMVPASGLPLRALGLPHARGRARLEHALSTSPRHGSVVLREPAIPFRVGG